MKGGISNMEIKTKKYYSLRCDPVFKSVFSDKKLIKQLLEECLEEKVEVLEIKLTEMSKKTILEHGKILDLIVKIKGKLVNVEVNTSFNEETRKRNFVYLCKIHSSVVKKGEKYTRQDESIQINFNYNISSKEKYKEVFQMKSKSGKDYNVGFKIITINVDKYKKAWYNKDIEIARKNPMLTAISFNDKKSLDEYADYMDDENIRRVKNKVEALNDDSIFASEISYYDRIRNEGYYDGEEKGEKKGLLKGLRKGKKEGKIQAKEEMAKFLLQLGKLSNDDISLCTGLSLDKLKKLKEEI